MFFCGSIRRDLLPYRSVIVSCVSFGRVPLLIFFSMRKAYAETDPMQRVPRSELVVRYQEFALKDLNEALARYVSIPSAELPNQQQMAFTFGKK